MKSGNTRVKYECPKGFEIQVVKTMETWQASLIATSVCVVISAVSIALTCYWERKHRDTDV